MACNDDAYLLGVLRKLQSLEVEPLKYILKDTFRGKIHETISLLALQLSKDLRMFHDYTL